MLRKLSHLLIVFAAALAVLLFSLGTVTSGSVHAAENGDLAVSAETDMAFIDAVSDITGNDPGAAGPLLQVERVEGTGVQALLTTGTGSGSILDPPEITTATIITDDEIAGRTSPALSVPTTGEVTTTTLLDYLGIGAVLGLAAITASVLLSRQRRSNLMSTTTSASMGDNAARQRISTGREGRAVTQGG